MGAYEYAALDAKGRKQSGVLAGDTARQVRQQLREQGLVPLAVEEVGGQEQGRRPGGLFRRHLAVGMPALVLFTRQLATMVRSGSALDKGLQVVANQTEQATMKKVTAALRSRVQEGQSLAAALGDFPAIFPDYFRATVAAGESSGSLDQVLERLADYVEFKQQLQHKVILALAYPVLLTSVALLVVIGLLGYVVPQVVTVFKNLHQQLPLLTRLLILTSDLVRHYGLVILVFTSAAVIIFRITLARPGARYQLHRFLLTLPLLGKFLQGLEVARFARTFSILVSSGVPALTGMTIAAEVMTNLALREAVSSAAQKVREGESISQALARTRSFPPLVIHLIASGEAGSDLARMLDQAATSQEQEISMKTGLATAIFEPLLILAMGGLVLLIVLAVLLPVFELNQLVH
ncbi:MAG: type II secretion system inner membrane protein GspF [Desulfobulbaceae bacterium]|nr:type II secretion system inner membrane protein GspF [Desulfobulbaceae bacterium]